MALPRSVDRLQRTAVLVTAALFSAGYAVFGLLLLLIAVVAEAVSVRRLPWSRSAVDLWLAAFLGAFLISSLLSPHRAIAVGSTGLAALTIYLALGVVQRVARRDGGFLGTLLWMWIAGAVGTSVLAFISHRRSAGGPAVTAALGQNALGTTLLIALMLGVAMVMIAPKAGKVLAVAAVAIIAAVLALTFTRGAWLGAAVGLAVVGGLSGGRPLRTGGLLVVLLAFAAVTSSDTVRARIVDRATRFDDPGTLGRIAIARSALNMFTDHPVLGTGLNTFAAVYPAYRLPGDPFPGGSMPFAHNIWLNMAAEGGLVGLVTFTGVLLAAIRSGWRWYRATAQTSQAIVAVSVLAATVGTLVHQLFDGTILSIHLGAGLWMLIGILTSRPGTSPPHA